MSSDQGESCRFFTQIPRRNSNSSTFDREAAEQLMRTQMEQSLQRRMQAAEEMFENRHGLNDSIAAEIYPTIVTIRTALNVMGTGFFQHSEWLVSNAHVIPLAEVINHSTITDAQNKTFQLVAESSYHRPSEKDNAPDVVIIKTRARNSSKSLPTEFTDDEAYNKSCIFYVAPILNNPGNFEIKFLRQRSKVDEYPIIYECEDGSEPQPGSSGSPIFEARVILGREPKWQFKVASALYARCSSDWSSQNMNITKDKGAHESRFVCAIPVIQEFSQILRIIQNTDIAERAKQMAAAASTINDNQGKKDVQKYTQMSSASTAESKSCLVKFESGDTILNISLPNGLEKLYYRGIVGIEDSLLIEKVRERVLGRKDARRYHNVKSVEFVDLLNDYNAFIEAIRANGLRNFRKENSFALSPRGYFRIDVDISNGDWVLDIQDNTGDFRHNNQSFSSLFAKVKIPKSHTSIEGQLVADLFIRSNTERKTIDILSTNETAQATARPRRP